MARTMVIDPHYHYLAEGWTPPRWLEATRPQISMHATGDPNLRGTILPPDFRTRMSDPSAERLLKKMDDCGIDLTCIMVNDFGIKFGDPPVAVEEQNRIVAELARKHPKRLMGFAMVDPRRPGAIALLERCIKEWGMKGIGEFHPDAGYDPTGPECFRLYEKLQEWDIPLLTHTGLFFPPMQLKYANPLLLDEVCGNFPDLKVIAGHAGRTLWWETVANLCRIHPNLYGEISGFQTYIRRNFSLFCKVIRRFIDIAGADKLLWATDDPTYDSLGIYTREFIDTIRNLPHQAADGRKFTEPEVEAMLGGNMQKILKLDA